MSAPTTSIAAAPALDKFPDWRRNYNSHPNWPCPPHENIQLAWGAITAWVDGLGAPESTATDARRIHIAVVIKELANALRRISHVAQALLTAGEGTIVTSIDSWRGHRKVCDDILTSAEEMLGHLAGALERCSDFSCPATLRATDAIIWLRTKGILTIDSDHRLSFTHESRIHAMTKTLGDTYRNMIQLVATAARKAAFRSQVEHLLSAEGHMPGHLPFERPLAEIRAAGIPGAPGNASGYMQGFRMPRMPKLPDPDYKGLGGLLHL